MPRLTHARLALLAAALAGCLLGPTPHSYEPATQAAGASVELWLGRRGRPSVKGELLAVPDDSTVVVRVGSTISRVRWRDVRQLRSRQAGLELYGGARVPADHHERLRLVSRFPQGITPELERALLAAHGQSAISELP